MEVEGSLLLMGLCPVSAITREPNENRIAFLDRLKEALLKFTNLDLESYEEQVIFFLNFILLYNTALVLPYIDMNPPRVYLRSQT